MIAVHAGIGRQNSAIAKLCARAVKESAGDAVNAVMTLEYDERTNCGIGSSLTANGTVECEAAYMTSDRMAFGAVGAVTNCKVVSYVAKQLAASQKEPSILIRPSVLVGTGAEKFAASVTSTCRNDELITVHSQQNYREANAVMESFDTVGAIGIQTDGTAEASTSSGGILLKTPGRLGHCTTFGASVWAETQNGVTVAISLSGCGEVISRNHFAEKLADSLFESHGTVPLQAVQNCVNQHFTASRLSALYEPSRRKVGGLIAVESTDLMELIAFHNTDSFAYAYCSNGKVSKRLMKNQDGHQFMFESFIL